MTERIRVLIADDHAVVRKGIAALLATEPDIEVVGEAADGLEAIAKARELHPDVLLLDLVMPAVDGIEAIRRIVPQQPGTRILVLTSFAGDDKVFPAIKAGALGYLLKDSGPEDLIRAIHQVHRGESSLHPSIARKLLRQLTNPAGQPTTLEQLTRREEEVLKLVAEGHSNQEIANRLVISETTVCTHMSNILRKLHLTSRTQAALYALRNGLISLEQCAESY